MLAPMTIACAPTFVMTGSALFEPLGRQRGFRFRDAASGIETRLGERRHGAL